MRYLRLTTTVLFTGALAAFAAEREQPDHSRTAVTAARTAGNSTIAQKTCPVTGKPIRKDLFVEQNGTKVYFCCPACIPQFKDSPMRYLPAVYRQDYPQSVQVKCAVMGGPLDGKTFTEHQGRRVDFCCDGCPQAFKADPAKYLAKKKQWSTDQVHCPVTGKAVNPRLGTQYDGRTVYFSSEDALISFKAEPAKYAAALRPEAGIIARGPTAEEDLILYITSSREASILDRKDLKPVVYEGKTYFLLGDDGVKRFQANPGGYAKALDLQVKKSLAALENLTSDTGSGATNHQEHGQADHRMGHAGHQH